MIDPAHLDPKHVAYIRAINKVADLLASKDIHLGDKYKRRDPREPGRAEKEAFEDRLEGLIQRRFNGQKRRIKEELQRAFPARKQGAFEAAQIAALTITITELLGDEANEAAILALIAAMFFFGIEIFDEAIELGFSLAEFQALAISLAQTQVGLLISGIDETTLRAVREAITLFVETPGMTLAQLIEILPFSEERARLIAISETTRAFGEAELMAALELQKQFPNVEVVIKWFTNNDPRVCVICIELDGQEVKPGEPFKSTLATNVVRIPGDPHPGDRCWIVARTRI